MDDAGDRRVGDGDVELVRRLAGELQPHPLAARGRVAVAQGGQPVRAVRRDVLLVAHAQRRRVEQAHHGGHDAVVAQAAFGEVALHRSAQAGEVQPELAQVVELGRLAFVAERVVVAVLLAAPGVAPGGLQVPVGLRRDPHVGPRRRDHQRLDPRHLALARRAPAAVHVAERAPSEPAEPRLRVRPVPQLRRRRGGARRRHARPHTRRPPEPNPAVHVAAARAGSVVGGAARTGQRARWAAARMPSRRRQHSSSVIDSTSAAKRPEANALSAGRPAPALTSTNSSNA